MDGVINLRGKVIPVIALLKGFRLSQQDHDKQTRIVVLEVQNMEFGLNVDPVSEVLRLPSDIIAPPPHLGRIEQELVAAVHKLEDRLPIPLDVDRIVGPPEVRLATAGA